MSVALVLLQRSAAVPKLLLSPSGGFLACPLGGRQVGRSVRALERQLERGCVDRAQVAACPAHPTPTARNRCHRLRCQSTEVTLLRGIEHEVEICAARRKRGKGAARSSKREPIEVRVRAGLLERERQFRGSLRADWHATEGIRSLNPQAAKVAKSRGDLGGALTAERDSEKSVHAIGRS